MEFGNFLDLAVDLELGISDLYKQIADRIGDESLAARLRILAKEEFNHANAIRRGKRYVEEMPDDFSGPMMSAADVKKGLEEIAAFKSLLEAAAPPFSEQLRKILDLEKRFEKIHMSALGTVKDRSLKRLFNMLAKGDQAHMLVLLGLIESLGEPS